MDDPVEISIPAAADAAALMGDPRVREAAGRVVSRRLRPGNGDDPFVAVRERLNADAAWRGLTQVVLDEELATYCRAAKDNEYL